MNITFGKYLFRRCSWASIFSTISWLLWKNRCKGVLEGSRVQAQEVIHNGLYQLMDSSLSNAFKQKIFHFTGKEHSTWYPPQCGYVRLDSDGSVNEHGTAACGGLVRDDKGAWIVGFQRKLGFQSTATAEVLALLTGLQLCKQYGFCKVIAYTDSMEAYHLVMKSGDAYHPLRSEILEIRNLIYSDWDLEIHYAPREAIRCADYLARDAQHLLQSSVVLPVPHSSCISFMRDDWYSFLTCNM